MKINYLTTLLFVLCITVSKVYTFHSLGHMAVAAIAEFHLKKSTIGSEAHKWATDLITPFSDYCGEINHPFVESATWSDKIKDQGWFTMANWHFSNIKLASPGFEIPVDNTSDENIVWAIDTATKFLSGNNKDFSGKSKELLGKSLEMRNLIHWIGDIH